MWGQVFHIMGITEKGICGPRRYVDVAYQYTQFTWFILLSGSGGHAQAWWRLMKGVASKFGQSAPQWIANVQEDAARIKSAHSTIDGTPWMLMAIRDLNRQRSVATGPHHHLAPKIDGWVLPKPCHYTIMFLTRIDIGCKISKSVEVHSVQKY